ncbi:ERV/ALR sulfhydryl oxidase domain-containing protein [Spinellus fusiger]|nr:ERV/ALR sulfhydryl oxidase domain-containing protein [Spinellus fusiger]
MCPYYKGIWARGETIQLLAGFTIMRTLPLVSFVACTVLLLTSFYLLYQQKESGTTTAPAHHGTTTTTTPATTAIDSSSSWQMSPSPLDVSKGGVIMSHLGNATAKAELGRSTWKLLHTMAARYPETPTPDERLALQQFITLLSRLYPCGECAEHFQAILRKYPPQTSSRVAASQWACAIHNQVNLSLGKEEYNCANIEANYACGCEADNKEAH